MKIQKIIAERKKLAVLFTVHKKGFKTKYIVYSVRSLDQSEDGTTQFLIFEDNNWIWVRANDYKPVKEEQ